MSSLLKALEEATQAASAGPSPQSIAPTSHRTTTARRTRQGRWLTAGTPCNAPRAGNNNLRKRSLSNPMTTDTKPVTQQEIDEILDWLSGPTPSVSREYTADLIRRLAAERDDLMTLLIDMQGALTDEGPCWRLDALDDMRARFAKLTEPTNG